MMNFFEKANINSMIEKELKEILMLLKRRKMEVAYTKYTTLEASMAVLGRATHMVTRLKTEMLSVGFKEWQFESFVYSYQHIGWNRYEYSGANWEV